MPTPPPGIILPTPTPVPPRRATPDPPLPLSVPVHYLLPTVLNFPANDIVYDPGTQRLYASIPSKAGAIGNSITVIDPASGTVGPSIFVGSEPNPLALSEDGATLWVGLDGAGTVRRFDVASLTPGAHFPVAGAQDPTPMKAMAILPLPRQPDTLVLLRIPVSGAGGYTVGVYDNGVMRPSILLDTGAGRSLSLAVDRQTGDLFSCLEMGRDGVVTPLKIDQRGIISSPTPVPGKPPTTPVPPFLVGCMPPIKIEGGLLYTGTGRVFDLASRTLVGSYPGVMHFALNPIAQRVYFLRTSLVEHQQPGLVYVFDQHTFRPVAMIQVSFSLQTYTGLVPWGDDGLVIFNNSQVNRVVLLRTSAPQP